MRAGLGSLFGLPDGWEIVLGNGGTTVFWDVASFGLVERRSQHLVFGEFSSKFAEVCAAAPHLDDPVVVSTEPGDHPGITTSDGVDVYALTHNETSTGVSMHLQRPAGSERRAGRGRRHVGRRRAAVGPGPGRRLLLRARRSASPPTGGCGWPRARRRPSSASSASPPSDRWRPASLDLGIALTNSRLDQTYNTPAVVTLLLLQSQVRWMLESGGLEWCVKRSQASSGHLYAWAEARAWATPFVADSAKRSAVVGTIDLDASIDAAKVNAALRANGIVDTDSYRKLGRNQLRIGMFPAIDPDDVEALTACLDFLVDHHADALSP